VQDISDKKNVLFRENNSDIDAHSNDRRVRNRESMIRRYQTWRRK